MRFAYCLLAFAILFAAAFSAYHEDLEIRVLDKAGRVVPNALVSVTYEISRSRGMYTTKEFLTNDRGRVYVSITNNEYNENDTNMDYTVKARFGTNAVSKKFTYKIGDYPRTLMLDAGGLSVHVTDRDNAPLSVPLSIMGIDGVSDANGNVFFTLPDGQYTLVAKYKGQDWKKEINMSGDTQVNFSIRVYNLKARIVDDRGNPIPAEVYVGAMQQQADPQGYVNFTDIPEQTPTVTVYSGSMKKAVDLDLGESEEAVIFFDTHAPSISNIETDWKGRSLQVRVAVGDNGTYAGGMRGGKAEVKLIYTSSGGVEKEVPMYTIGYNLYEGLIPVAGTEESIKYTVLATDYDGNSRSSSDTFVLPTNRGSNAVQADEPPPAVVAPSSGDNGIFLFVIIGIAVIVVAAVGYYYRDRLPFVSGSGEFGLPKPPLPQDEKKS